MTASGATNASVIYALFTEPNEWISEIIRDGDLVERQLARVTKTVRPVLDGAATRADVVASAIVESRIILLQTCVGDLWALAADEQVQERAGRIARELEEEQLDAGLEVCTGIWEAP